MKKSIILVTGLLPVVWYVQQIQGIFMQKTVLDYIITGADACAMFPTTSEQMIALADRSKKQTLQALETLIAIPAQERTFANTAAALDALSADLGKVAGLLEVISVTSQGAAMRDKAQALMIDLQNFIVDHLSLNKAIYRAFKEYAAQQEENLTIEQHYYITESLKDFKKSGFELPDDQQERLKTLQKELANLSTQFEVNIAKDARSITVTRAELAGLTDEQVIPYKTGDDSYVLKTDYPTMDLILENCTLESTRKALWKEFNNRAHPTNMDILASVIKVRHEIASILGYPSYAACNLDDSMAESVNHVEHFLQELEQRSTIKTQQEFAELTSRLPESVTLTQQGQLKPWDVKFVANMYKKREAALDERAIAEYFPLEKTIDALLALYEEFLGLELIQLTPPVKLWADDIKFIKAMHNGQLLGYLFLDLHPRDNKYTHACHAGIIHGLRDASGAQTVPAVSVVIANFPKSTGEKPALLLRNDVNTFFHEFGHAVHALCGATTLNAFSGTSVKRDFVELPSQMLEEWLWQPAVLKRISSHYISGESLSDELIDTLLKIKNFATGFFIKRQLALSYLSLACFDSKIDANMKYEYQQLFERLMPYQEYCSEENFISSFGHLMGYGAQYYGYLWSKVFALDLFDYIKQNGMTPAIGARYRDLVIGKGGSKHPRELLVDFLGREPNSDAFFRDMGI